MATEPIKPLPAPLAIESAREGRIGPLLKISGVITGDADLQIDGEVEGAISLPSKKLTVGHSGRLKCDVNVLEMVIHGRVEGKIQARGLVAVKKDSTVIGEIRAARISIEDGARFEGYIETQRPDSAS